MGSVSKKLHSRLATKAHLLPTQEPRRRPGELLPGGVKDIPSLIRDGYDPIHAVYIFLQNLSSRFVEGASRFPELKAYVKAVGDAEDEYLPSGPPMSPLTGSYFTCWAFYDLRFGRDGETIAQCQTACNDILWMNADQLNALQQMSDSRMGVYEHGGWRGPHIRLRELITGCEFVCHSPSGYRGRHGELWFVRLLPPLMPEKADYHIAFTTPYVLIGHSRAEWTQYLQRTLVQVAGSDDLERLYKLFKYGLDANYWNEFIFKAYHHHQPEAIFLSGIPDLQHSMLHA